MKILYDKGYAAARKEQLDNENAREYARTEKWLILGGITGVLGLICFGVSVILSVVELFFCDLPNPWDRVPLWSIIAVIPLMMLTCLFGNLSGDSRPHLRVADYPMDVQYMLLTEGKTVLEHQLACDNTFLVTMEDESHTVTEGSIKFEHAPQIKTNVSELTVDLMEGVLYIPFVPTADKNDCAEELVHG